MSVILLGSCFAAIGVLGYAKAMWTLIRLQQMNHLREKPRWTDTTDALYDLAASGVVGALGVLIAGVAW